MLLIEEVK